MTTDFRFYLNRQGIQGRKGEKGEQGYSPTITVKSQTANEYVLTVQNEDGSFDTPNLRGNAIENRGGNYVRYNPNTEEMYTGDADLASTQRAGVVFLSTYEQLIAGGSENLVPTSQDVYNFVSQQIISGFVTQQEFDTYTAATAITLNNLSTQKLSFADLSNAIIAGSNITLSVDSENNTITINAAGGDLSNYVTLDTTQTITGVKNFLNGLNSQGNFNISGDGSYLMLNNSVFRQDVNSNNLEILSPASILLRTSTRDVDVNDILTSSSLGNVVTTNTAQTITNSKTFDGNGVIHFSNTSNGIYFEDSSSTERIRIFTARHSSGTDYSDLTMQSYSDMQFRLLSPATTVKLTEIKSGIELANTALQQSDLTPITDLIPAQASTSNQLADKAFVNSSVQTATANFRGNWSSWASVPSTASSYPADYAGSTTPTVNDYMVVQDASDYTGDTLDGTWRFKYSGDWNTDGKNGWHPEYQVNETPLTAAQLAALNSGITTALTAQISTNQSNIAGLQNSKQDVISDLAAIRANATAGEEAKTAVDAMGDIVSHNASEFQAAGDYISYTNNTVEVVGTSKTLSKISPNAIYVSNGLVMGGTAQDAGMVTRGICGIGTPTTTGACTKENLYINYDGSNTYNSGRQVVIQAGNVGTHYGNNLYQYAAARGDAVKDYADAHYVGLNSSQNIGGNKTFKGITNFQNGSAYGCMYIGADLDGTSLTQGARKLGRMCFHTSDLAIKCAFLSVDTLGGNAIEFGGRTGDVTNTSPDYISFTVANLHNSLDSKIQCFAINHLQANFYVQPKYNNANLATESYVDNAIQTSLGNIETLLNNINSGSGS